MFIQLNETVPGTTVGTFSHPFWSGESTMLALKEYFFLSHSKSLLEVFKNYKKEWKNKYKI
jgi:hypothetical protein